MKEGRERIHPITYIIKRSSFENPTVPYNPHYNFGDRPRRDTFVASMILSFSHSRGDLGAQKAWLEYLKEHSKFNYEESIKNYLLAGGFNCLREEEKASILRAVRNVGSHKKPLKESIDEKIIAYFDKYLKDMLLGNDKFYFMDKLSVFNWKKLSPSEFLVIYKQQVELLIQERKKEEVSKNG